MVCFQVLEWRIPVSEKGQRGEPNWKSHSFMGGRKCLDFCRARGRDSMKEGVKLLRRLGRLHVNDCNEPFSFSAWDIWLGLPGWWPTFVRWVCSLLPQLGHWWSTSNAATAAAAVLLKSFLILPLSCGWHSVLTDFTNLSQCTIAGGCMITRPAATGKKKRNNKKSKLKLHQLCAPLQETRIHSWSVVHVCYFPFHTHMTLKAVFRNTYEL